MRSRVVILATLISGLGAWELLHAQKPFKEYAGFEYTDFAVPPDANVPHEWTRARLKYTQYAGGFGRRGFGGGRSEERRVGKECRSRWSAHHSKNKEAIGAEVGEGGGGSE